MGLVERSRPLRCGSAAGGFPAGAAFSGEQRYYPTGPVQSNINVPPAGPERRFLPDSSDSARPMTVPENPAESSSRTTIRVDLGPRSYDIDIEAGSLPQIASRLATWRKSEAPGRSLIVTDTNIGGTHARTVVNALRASGWLAALQVLPPGEQSKSFPILTAIYDALAGIEADRKTLVVALGGGVTGDVAGFAAATYNRGVPFVQVPTTLLAMVDSSVGGKVGINHAKGKNLIGAFHQPLGVLIDPDVLATLPDREYRGGLAEVVKYGVILDPGFFSFLETNIEAITRREPAALSHVIARSCRLKADVVEKDEYETTGLRAILNYGHTFGHAFEALAGYGGLTHGEAVAIGMVCASRLAERRGLIGDDVTAQQVTLLQAFGLPTALPEDVTFPAEQVLSRMRLDKKSAGGRLRFILPTRIGEVRLFDDVPEEDVVAVLKQD